MVTTDVAVITDENGNEWDIHVAPASALVMVEPPNTVLTHGPFYLTETGVTESREPTFDEWNDCFDWAQKAERSVQFWLGDLMEIGERKFGDKYTQALEATPYAEQTLKNFTYVSRSLPQSRRFPTDKVPFSSQAEVASLSPEKQTEFLQRAADEHLTRDALRSAIRESRAAETGKTVEFWLVVRCSSAQDQMELSERLRLEGRAVKLR